MNKISKILFWGWGWVESARLWVHFVDGDRQIAIGARLSARACRFIL